jgi:hypothetical protein
MNLPYNGMVRREHCKEIFQNNLLTLKVYSTYAPAVDVTLQVDQVSRGKRPKDSLKGHVLSRTAIKTPDIRRVITPR